MTEDRDGEFERLWRYYPAVVAHLKRLGFDLDNARDLAQDVFVRVYEAMATYRGEARLAFLQTVTRRLASNAIRDSHAIKRDGVAVSLDAVLNLRDPRIEAADVALERKERGERLSGAIDQLPSRDRTAIRMALSGLSYDEIAPLMGVTVSALKSRLNVARKRLREMLGEDVEDIGGRR